MIYDGEKTGVFKINNDLGLSSDLTIGYRVGRAFKESTINFHRLPSDIKDDLARVSNKIARYVEEELS